MSRGVNCAHHGFGVALGEGEVRPEGSYSFLTMDVGTGKVTVLPDPIPPSVSNRICRMAWWY